MSLLKIGGYNLISVGKTCSAHGGLAIYLNDEMNYKILSLYEQSNIWEGQFIEVRKLSSSKKLIIGNIYRPPNNTTENYNCFSEELSRILAILTKSKSDVIIAGDHRYVKNK